MNSLSGDLRRPSDASLAEGCSIVERLEIEATDRRPEARRANSESRRGFEPATRRARAARFGSSRASQEGGAQTFSGARLRKVARSGGFFAYPGSLGSKAERNDAMLGSVRVVRVARVATRSFATNLQRRGPLEAER
jgi:hypothetical protein